MVTSDSGANFSGMPERSFLSRYIFTGKRTNHKTIGLNYLWLALFSVFVGMLMSLIMRIHQVWPGVDLSFAPGLGGAPDRYAALTLLHGSLMVFMVLTAAPQAGFGNYFLPIQIGARDMAFPALNLGAFCATVFALLGMTAAFFLRPETGITVWIASVAIFCAAFVATSLNFSVTTIDLRAKGMTLPRLPVTVWAWFLNGILGMLIFSILLAACTCLLSDRILHTQFFSATNFLAGAPKGIAGQESWQVWQRLFWFFAQAEVYVAMLPCFGLATHLIATFSRKPVWRERAVVLALCAVGLFGFCIWGQHMFSSGLNPYSPLFFSVLASSLGLPASILLMSWLGTLWNAKTRLTTAMLFAIGFVSLFISGGLSGLFLARRDVIGATLTDDFVNGHFHLVMGVAATFAILGALFFWFPKMFGRRLDERLGKTHFWLTFAGVYCVFMPMHWLGMIAKAGASSEAHLAALADAGSSVRAFMTVATIATVAVQGLFLINFVWSLKKGEKAGTADPWNAATLEWSIASPPPLGNFEPGAPVVYRGAYEFAGPEVAEIAMRQDKAPVEAESRERESKVQALGPDTAAEIA